jgi:hypothetical protein
MSFYHDDEDDTWERDTRNRVTLIKTADGSMIGDPEYTDVPFADAARFYGLVKCTVEDS